MIAITPCNRYLRELRPGELQYSWESPDEPLPLEYAESDADDDSGDEDDEDEGDD
jgi:hypothetical protein